MRATEVERERIGRTNSNPMSGVSLLARALLGNDSGRFFPTKPFIVSLHRGIPPINYRVVKSFAKTYPVNKSFRSLSTGS